MGNLAGGGVRERGRGDRTGDGSETCKIQVINLKMRETRSSVSGCKQQGWIIKDSSHTINPGCHNADSHLNSNTAVRIEVH